jgi:hypothetical protein
MSSRKCVLKISFVSLELTDATSWMRNAQQERNTTYSSGLAC